MKMREVIANRGTFYDWLKLQPEKPTKTELVILQVRFEEMQEALQTLQPTKAKCGQFIVVSTKDNKPIYCERKVFKIHSTEQAAGKYGKLHHLFRQWKIMPYTTWSRSWEGRCLMRYQHNITIKSLTDPPPCISSLQKTTTNKPAKDKIEHLKGEAIKLQTKGDTLGVARINQQIKKLKRIKPK